MHNHQRGQEGSVPPKIIIRLRALRCSGQRAEGFLPTLPLHFPCRTSPEILHKAPFSHLMSCLGNLSSKQVMA